MATVRPRGESWQAQVKVGRQRLSRSFATKEQAILWARQTECAARFDPFGGSISDEDKWKARNSPLSDQYWSERLGLPIHSIYAIRNGYMSADEVSAYLWHKLQKAHTRTRKKGIEVSLSRECVDFLAQRSAGACEVTDVPFIAKAYGVASKQPAGPFSPTIDRIDSSLGYQIDNCRVVCYAANLAMSSWGEDVLAAIAHAYVTRVSLTKTLERRAGNFKRKRDAA